MPKPRIRSLISAFMIGAILAVATLIAYLAWIGWDQTKQLGADGYLHGPYESWQVAGLVITVLALAAIGGWRGQVVASILAIPAVLTLTWSVDAATDAGMENDGLWPIGSTMIAGGSFVGVFIVSAVVDAWIRSRTGVALGPSGTSIFNRSARHGFDESPG